MKKLYLKHLKLLVWHQLICKIIYCKEQLKGKFEFIDMPPGNCLFYSIIEQLKNLDIYPMNFKSEDTDEQYSRETQNLKLIAGDMNTEGPIHYEAALQLRKDIVDKMRLNFKQLEKDIPNVMHEDLSEGSEIYADLIASYRNILLTNRNIDEYLQNMSLSAKPPNKGLWGGANEIIVSFSLIKFKYNCLSNLMVNQLLILLRNLKKFLV